MPNARRCKTTSDLEINKDKKPPPPSMLAISTDQKLNSNAYSNDHWSGYIFEGIEKRQR
jgi:hypothetical protein